MQPLGSTETTVLTREKHRNIPEDAILHSYRRENLKSYRELKSFTGEIMFTIRQNKTNSVGLSQQAN
jgi:hypothetical protein